MDGGAPLAAPSWSRRVLLFTTYFASIMGVGLPPLLYASMVNDGMFTAAEASTILGIQTIGSESARADTPVSATCFSRACARPCAASAGKFAAGFVADALGGRRANLAAFAAVSAALALLSAAPSLHVVAVCAFAVEAANAPIWPAHARIIRGWFPADGLAGAFWILSVSSRGTNLLAGLFYGAALSVASWRAVALLGAAFSVAGLALCTRHLDAPSAAVVAVPGAARPARALASVRKVVRERSFWVASASLAALTVVKRMGQAMPVYFFSVAPDVLDSGTAAQVAIVFQAGLASSVLVGGYAYARLGRRGKVLLCAALHAATVVACVALALLRRPAGDAAAVAGRAALTFAVAAGVGVSYYLPPGIFSVQLGGRERTGVVSALMDVVGYGTSAVFLLAMEPVIEGASTGPAAGVAFGTGWSGVWLIIAGAGVVALVFSAYFHWQLHADDDVAPAGAAARSTAVAEEEGVPLVAADSRGGGSEAAAGAAAAIEMRAKPSGGGGLRRRSDEDE